MNDPRIRSYINNERGGKRSAHNKERERITTRILQESSYSARCKERNRKLNESSRSAKKIRATDSSSLRGKKKKRSEKVVKKKKQEKEKKPRKRQPSNSKLPVQSTTIEFDRKGRRSSSARGFLCNSPLPSPLPSLPSSIRSRRGAEKVLKRLPGKTDSRGLPSPAHAPPTPPPRVFAHTHPLRAGTRGEGGGGGGTEGVGGGVGGRVAAKARGARSPPAVSTSRDKAAKRRRRWGKEGEAHTLKTGVNGQLSNGGSPGSPWTHAGPDGKYIFK